MHKLSDYRALSHDNIVAFRGWGVDRECYYLVMEYLEINLKEYVLEQESHDNHGLTSRLTWEIAKQIAQAMAYLHSLEIPIAHLDLKPDNILVRISTEKFLDLNNISIFQIIFTEFGMVV